jgi:hypothetical protein
MNKTKSTYKLQYPDLLQPRDKNHPLYQLLDEYIITGDQKQIALKLNVSEPLISDVKNGKQRSRNVWDCLMVIMMRRKKERDRVLAYMGVQQQQAA